MWGWLPPAWGLCAAYTRAAGTFGGASRGTPPQSVLVRQWLPLLWLQASWPLLLLAARPRLVAELQRELPPAVLVKTRNLVVALTWYVIKKIFYSINDRFKMLEFEQRKISFGFVGIN